MKRLKRVRRILIWWLTVVVSLLRWAFFYEQIQLQEHNLKETYWVRFERVETGYVEYNWREVFYVDMWDEEDQPVMLLHGAWWSVLHREGLLKQPELQVGYRFILIDRFWYGNSWRGKAEVSILAQSKAYHKVLEELDLLDKKAINIGISYWWTISAKMAELYNDIRWGTILLAAAVDPDHEVVFWISHRVKYQPLKFLIAPWLRVSNDEKLSHVEMLQKEMWTYENVDHPVLIVHSKDDPLVPIDNIEILVSQIDEQHLEVWELEWNVHAMQFSRVDIIKDAIEEVIKKMK